LQNRRVPGHGGAVLRSKQFLQPGPWSQRVAWWAAEGWEMRHDTDGGMVGDEEETAPVLRLCMACASWWIHVGSRKL
jgi:hypothetical protein